MPEVSLASPESPRGAGHTRTLREGEELLAEIRAHGHDDPTRMDGLLISIVCHVTADALVLDAAAPRIS